MKQIRWHFPLITPGRKDTEDEMVHKVLSEIKEFQSATDNLEKGLEVLDILHAAETLVRKFFYSHPNLSIKKMRRMIYKKNEKRGYYY